MADIDFPKIIKYYSRTLAGCLTSGGEDWRYDLYREKLDRIMALSAKANLTPEDHLYLRCRQSVAEGMG